MLIQLFLSSAVSIHTLEQSRPGGSNRVEVVARHPLQKLSPRVALSML